ncbi:hypothetical protein [Aliiroseovarius lamellibrachiae]|uniref:hypothetical protein n=1 Tax=Aliiroseovarius lamellibrachiae TaxID=1924933 RepID=UPI001BE074A1|nr:hypothetical protein [Aliiroseovarius lamellibrachiae]MBT2131036.1 hypothetical protein [Aliiroseovarius lamellibrachiae]
MQMNLKQAVEILDAGELPYSPANAAKVRGSANKCARLPGYNCDISRIPVDPDAFVERWHRNMQNKDAPEGFKTFKQFSTWHSNVKSLMDHVSGTRRERDLLRDVEDDWSQLLEATSQLIRRTHKGTGIQQIDLVAVMVLRNFARENNRQPHQLTAGLIHSWMQSATASQRTAMRNASKIINKLLELDHDLPEDLLPGKIEEIPMVTARRVTPTLPPKLERAISDMQAELREGERYSGLLKNKRKDPCSEGTVKNAREAAQWFYSCMVELDLLDLSEDPDPVTFATMGHILAAFEAEVAGDFYWKPLAQTTVRKNLEGTFRFLRRFNSDLKSEQKEFFQGTYFENWDSMTADNQAFCRRLMNSDHSKAKFFSLARLFHEKAAPLITRYDDLPHNQKAQAANWALAAAAAAVLTFLPVRADTAIQLTVEGPDAHVTLPVKSKFVKFALPPEIIKNKNSITAEISRRGKVDPRAILEWWLKIARPVLMSRLQNPDPTLLLGGAGYARLNKAWRFATASVDFYMNLHQVRHAIASILWNEPGADINVIASLLGDHPETVARVYAFLDVAAQMQRGMDGMAAVNAELERKVRP